MFYSTLGCLVGVRPRKAPVREIQVKGGWSISYLPPAWWPYLVIRWVILLKGTAPVSQAFPTAVALSGFCNPASLCPSDLGWWQLLAASISEVLHHWFALPLCVMINLVCHLDWAKGCPESWPHIISGCVCEDVSGRD